MDNPKVEVKNTPAKGRGVFAKEPIKKDEIIAAFDGEIYEYNYPDWNDDLADHCIQFENFKWRDSNGIARVINHSCKPNCGIRNLFQVVAMRDIEPGEEITWDYEMTGNNPEWRMKCKCGEENCRKIIGKHDNMPEEVRMWYGNYISEWLLNR
jgi:SET domain-containing protein